MTDEIVSSFNLKQVTCTIDDETYWSEQILESNEATARFAHIDIGGTIADKDDEGDDGSEEEDEEEGSMENDAEDEEDPESDDDDEFGF